MYTFEIKLHIIIEYFSTRTKKPNHANRFLEC